MFVPTKDNIGRPIRAGILNHFRDKMNEQFGGTTLYDAQGCYLDNLGEGQCEPIRVMTAVRVDPNCDLARRDNNVMKELANEIAQFFGQDGVFGTISNVETFYVEGEKRPQAFPELIG